MIILQRRISFIHVHNTSHSFISTNIVEHVINGIVIYYRRSRFSLPCQQLYSEIRISSVDSWHFVPSTSLCVLDQFSPHFPFVIQLSDSPSVSLLIHKSVILSCSLKMRMTNISLRSTDWIHPSFPWSWLLLNFFTVLQLCPGTHPRYVNFPLDKYRTISSGSTRHPLLHFPIIRRSFYRVPPSVFIRFFLDLYFKYAFNSFSFSNMTLLKSFLSPCCSVLLFLSSHSFAPVYSTIQLCNEASTSDLHLLSWWRSCPCSCTPVPPSRRDMSWKICRAILQSEDHLDSPRSHSVTVHFLSTAKSVKEWQLMLFSALFLS